MAVAHITSNAIPRKREIGKTKSVGEIHQQKGQK